MRRWEARYTAEHGKARTGMTGRGGPVSAHSMHYGLCAARLRRKKQRPIGEVDNGRAGLNVVRGNTRNNAFLFDALYANRASMTSLLLQVQTST